MKLAYFKHSLLGDCYVPNNDFCKILTIPKESDPFILADDENIVNGLYKILKISKQDYKELRSSVQNRDRDREKAITLLKQLHKENKDTLTSNIFEVKETSFSSGYYNKEMQEFLNTPAILK